MAVMKYINLMLFAGMIILNYLANALPLNNMTTGQLSDKYPNLFVPAGVTFSIWGIIYLLLAVFCVLQFYSVNQPVIDKIGWSFAISCLLNGLWIVFWHYQKVPLSVIIMLGLLLTLIYVNMQLRNLPPGMMKAAFGVYLGWICIALIANVTALLVYYKWNGAGIPEETWAIIMIFAGAVITSFAIYSFRNPFIGLSVIWAFIGIIIKRHTDFKSIVIACIIAIIVVSVITAVHFISRGMYMQSRLTS